ncbi:MAG: 16S rRNA (uracil(1498)-N(3))-methyltransferase [Synergistaceae bacterium]|nr:16S rRNA (uracil(1498)-N(3))-methyltransferase [Synergistaceae bacterium]
MSLPKIRLERCVCEGGGLWRLDSGQARRLVRSLRLYEGAVVEGLLGDDGGRRFIMRLERRAGDYFLREISAESEPRDDLEITLVLGLLKSDQFDAVLRSASELGISLIQPVICAHSVPRVAASDIPKKISRWQKILDEGTSLSGSVFPPKISPPVKFDDINWDALPETRYAAVISSSSHPIACADCRTGRLVFAVGPEGDWSDSERDALVSHGFVPLTLGKRIMRASTAAITGVAWFRFNELREPLNK